MMLRGIIILMSLFLLYISFRSQISLLSNRLYARRQVVMSSEKDGKIIGSFDACKWTRAINFNIYIYILIEQSTDIVVIVIVIITLPLGLSAFEQRGCESSHSKNSLGLNP